jgi:hypothetical protein
MILLKDQIWGFSMDLFKIIFKKLNYFAVHWKRTSRFNFRYRKFLTIYFLLIFSISASAIELEIPEESDISSFVVIGRTKGNIESSENERIYFQKAIQSTSEYNKKAKEVPVSSFSTRTFPDGTIGGDVKYIGTFVQDPELANSWGQISQSGSDIVGKCWDSRNSADSYCLESLSPDLQSTVGTIQQIAAAAQMGGIFDICKTSGKILNVAQAGMTAYTAACGLAKSSCDTSCKEALDGLKNFRNTVMKYCNHSYAAATKGIDPGKFQTSCSKVNTFLNQQLDKGLKATVSSNAEKCKTYSEQIKTGVIAGVGLFSSIMRSQACQKASSAVNCAQNPFDPKCAPKKKLCSDPSVANTPECICQINPHSTGCGANTASSDSYKVSPISSREDSGSVASSPGPNNLGASSNNGVSEGGTAGGFGGAGFSGGAAGGGGGFGGGGGGSPVNAKGTASNTGSKIGDGGFDSSGGGGGRRGNSNSKMTDDPQALGKYLPKTPRGANYVPGSEPMYEISTAHGKTLFDRVSDRYQDMFK